MDAQQIMIVFTGLCKHVTQHRSYHRRSSAEEQYKSNGRLEMVKSSEAGTDFQEKGEGQEANGNVKNQRVKPAEKKNHL